MVVRQDTNERQYGLLFIGRIAMVYAPSWISREHISFLELRYTRYGTTVEGLYAKCLS